MQRITQRISRPLCRALSSSASAARPSPRETILAASLTHVHTHGWTEQALAQGVITSKLPPSYIGLVEDKKSEMVHYFMKDCNDRLKDELELNIAIAKMTHTEVIKWCIRERLSMNIPFVRSKRWHEGMALGAMPLNALETANHLEEIVKIIEQGMMLSSSPSQQSIGRLELGLVGAVYIATELHLLSDESDGFRETWNFLDDRAKELASAASSPFPSPDMIVAGSAVASSLAGAVVSLAAPAAQLGVQTVAGSVVPQIMAFMQPPTIDSTVGTKAKDYDLSDLPPFETQTRNSDQENKR
mmetsp:Transcript_8217/g.11681  ORF Transcript_8217/g.11681 Transcript_8217/m.11681 type:complete len:300 (+) Transcript_8217:145-1044(+)